MSDLIALAEKLEEISLHMARSAANPSAGELASVVRDRIKAAHAGFQLADRFRARAQNEEKLG